LFDLLSGAGGWDADSDFQFDFGSDWEEILGEFSWNFEPDNLLCSVNFFPPKFFLVFWKREIFLSKKNFGGKKFTEQKRLVHFKQAYFRAKFGKEFPKFLC
jgi:hypothetical protein